MGSVTLMRAAKVGYIIMSAAFCALGAAIFAVPEAYLQHTGGVLLGAGMIAFGAVKLMGYFSKDLYRLAFQYDLAFGAMLIVIGITVLTRPGEALPFFCTVMGVLALADGLLKVQISLDSKRFGIRAWWLIIALALVTSAAGIVTLCWPHDAARALSVLMALLLLADGALNMCVAVCTVKVMLDRESAAADADRREA